MARFLAKRAGSFWTIANFQRIAPRIAGPEKTFPENMAHYFQVRL
jgi:hypothetical protein